MPAAGGVLLAGRGWRWPRGLTKLVGPGVVWLSFVCVAYMFWQQMTGAAARDITYYTWIRSGAFTLPANLLVDHLSLFMCMVITGVGGLIVTYAVGYMAHETDASYARFFCYMDVFIFSMLLLVLAGNFVFLIMGWALVGLSSYLLIGFYYWRPAAVLAARKAFVMNVIGDIGLILAAFFIFTEYHQTTYVAVFHSLPRADGPQLEVIAFLLLLGGVAKSAQLPLHTWLPDAMEGPTPVSALIHAATMVTAGVYLVGRMHPFFDVAQYAHDAVAIIGAATAIFAASIALVQTDIKRVLAYSTMSQIGYMFLAVGIGAYAAGFFHLLAHAFFKALLFMAAGNVIRAMNDDQDMRHYGGLRRDLVWTSRLFLVGSLALAGVIPFAGFFSKELILGLAFSKPSVHYLGQLVWSVGFVTAVLTAFYTGRMWWISFGGEPSAERRVQHPHGAPAEMMVPLALLGVLTTVGGFLQVEALYHQGWALVSDFLAPAVGRPYWGAAPLDYAVTAATLLLSIGGFALAYYFYVVPRFRAAAWRARLPRLQALLERKYYIDELYDRAFVRPLDWTAVAVERWIDGPFIDGTVMGLGGAAVSSAEGLSLTQTGYFRNYVLVFMGGAVIGAVIVLFKALG